MIYKKQLNINVCFIMLSFFIFIFEKYISYGIRFGDFSNSVKRLEGLEIDQKRVESEVN